MTAAETVAVQKTIYQTVRADPRLDHVVVLGPAAHAIVLDNHHGRDYVDLVNAGITPYQDAQAVHSYAAASNITTKLHARLDYVYAAFGDNYPVQLTETGWTTGGTTGTPQNTEADAATYAAQAVLIMAGLRIPTMRYETLDDSPMGGERRIRPVVLHFQHRHLPVACQARGRLRREPAPCAPGPRPRLHPRTGPSPHRRRRPPCRHLQARRDRHRLALG